jgi:hypothetical protein
MIMVSVSVLTGLTCGVISGEVEQILTPLDGLPGQMSVLFSISTVPDG